ncbi:alpha,alpha-trehalose-phosphate synthase [UDP-forming] 1 isoform X1 [Arachis ipaensis]|uniref:alpha,alpha-trehalose-phosphate synthase [UDP-forming] 1 isoform X1 n=1 Tax=Arachis ipaensis TaxID=130454 RepID=UPI0007AEFDD9|nr:alpha,alpha-trehalose-phosphate synthase [UDP-forming] 1 isoform X1 [Arachis ipaensis]XP_016170166.1 alpha,alpha-trehalose-phosphate synthase [UDP-forming] 1 isoform X1 [Arachis ipaensis]XP_016170167.1 alpha,alpha-trehalose-phosphate synthase [UDP-forming] 1 isoform X1 [Arachis ipaensis]XP_016170168.1 alpha,alpha-trehalose-phosphate synthase [UDP-forming] 1 isoform X1 [Arachis ipaensis]XP_020965002.1 alpha,alpha-trehalose-phosphate synthase [UDP-forming] 1 isoform X1 [Arachis ipaensis]XP_02
MVGFQSSEHMPGSKCNGNSNNFPGRVERLVRGRELRKSNIYNVNGVAEYFEHDLRLGEENNYCVERSLEGVAASKSLCERDDGKPFRQRLLVVANRLPVSAVRRGEDSWSLEISAGGLVSALLGVKEFEARWIGWAGVNVPDEIGQKALTKALAEKRCIPVFLDEEIVHQYYNGYCNNILWPLFHYLGLPQEDRLATTRSFQSQFTAYQKANQMFADVVNEHYEEGDVVWCHDYHLMFLPQCLKKYNSNMKVGWFLHTPFPSSEIHRTLPSRSELLHAVLAADLVGFHTYDYARHFVSACTRILGLEGTPEGVEYQGKLTRVAAFPIGIDSHRFKRALELPEVQKHIKDLEERFKHRKVMLGVDRLDMIKGIPQKILAFEKFLEENPDWREKVVLLQIAVPTRTDVPEYQKLTSQVHEIVGRINGRFGSLTAVPIHHLDRSLDFYALCALYAVTDVALVTSLRDGMNLVSYEFVACQAKKKGVLILSEFAGAAQSLGAGAILVNPWNITEVAAAIDKALNMEPVERQNRHKHNFEHVTQHTAQEWAETFVSELNDTVVEAQLRTKQAPPRLPTKTAIERYLQSSNRLLILGFNGTLTEPVEKRGDQFKEMELTVHPELKQPLKELCSDPKTTIVVLSGSGRAVLDQNFKEYDMWLAAENGMFLNPSKGEWMTTMPEQLNMEWVDSLKHVFLYFRERTPRSCFEEREASLVWNYKHADVEFGRVQARDMLQHLWTGPISNASVEVVQGSRSVEVRAAGVTKGAAIDRILGEIVHSKSMTTPIDYVLCIGHFLAKQDEDIYAFFEPELPSSGAAHSRSKVTDGIKFPGEKMTSLKIPANKNGTKSSQNKAQRPAPNSEKKPTNHVCRAPRRPAPEKISWNVLDLKKENYFSCAVGRTQTNARYTLGSSDDVVAFLKELAGASSNSLFQST